MAIDALDHGPAAASRRVPSLEFFDRPDGQILRAAQEAIVIIDEGQHIVALNPAAEQIFRCTVAQVLGQPLTRFIPEHHRAEHGVRVREFSSSDTLQQRLHRHRRITATRADGSEFPAEITLSRIDMAAAEGTRRFYAALLTDMSEESHLRRQLEEFKRRVLSVFEFAPVAIWIADDDHIVFANQAAERLFGSAGIVGRAVHELLQPGAHEAVRTQLARALSGDPDVALVHGRIARPDGSQREVEIALSPLPDHGQTTVQMVIADVTQQRLEAAELARSHTSLRQLSSNVVDAREEERRRIARELHDELGQRLTALKMELSALAGATTQRSRTERVDNMLAMLDDTLASVRRISSDLRPMMLDDLGLNAAIEWLARDMARRTGIEITVQLGENEVPVNDRVATAAFRMVQEALTNVARHARATDVQVELRQSGGELVLTVQDNGIGYPQRAMQREGSFGLLGMRERAQMLGGRIETDNVQPAGARLTVHLPLAAPADAGDPSPAGEDT